MPATRQTFEQISNLDNWTCIIAFISNNFRQILPLTLVFLKWNEVGTSSSNLKGSNKWRQWCLLRRNISHLYKLWYPIKLHRLLSYSKHLQRLYEAIPVVDVHSRAIIYSFWTEYLVSLLFIKLKYLTTYCDWHRRHNVQQSKQHFQKEAFHRIVFCAAKCQISLQKLKSKGFRSIICLKDFKKIFLNLYRIVFYYFIVNNI